MVVARIRSARYPNSYILCSASHDIEKIHIYCCNSVFLMTAAILTAGYVAAYFCERKNNEAVADQKANL